MLAVLHEVHEQAQVVGANLRADFVKYLNVVLEACLHGFCPADIDYSEQIDEHNYLDLDARLLVQEEGHCAKAGSSTDEEQLEGSDEFVFDVEVFEDGAVP